MDNDDEPIGRLLTRREMLKLLAALGAATAAGCVPRVIPETATTAPTATAAPPTTAATGPGSAIPTATTGAATVAPTPTAEPAAATAVPVPACVVRRRP